MRPPFLGFLILATYLYLEVSAFGAFSSLFGGLGVFIEIVGSFFLGAYIGRTVFADILRGKVAVESFLLILGAILWMIPGLITDFIGLLFSFSFIRESLNPYFTRGGAMDYTNNKFFKDRFVHEGDQDNTQETKSSVIIDADFHEIKDDKHKGE